MTYQLTVHHGADLYEVTVREATIVRIRKFLGDSQLVRELDLDDVPWDAQMHILAAITTKRQNEKTTDDSE